MKHIFKLTRAALFLTALVALSGCGLGQAASPTPEPVDVNAVMTSAASTAFVELTAIAQQASATPSNTPAPTVTPTLAAVATETTPQPGNTADPALEVTSTSEAGGLPATPTLPVMAGTQIPPVVPSLTPLAPAAPANTGPTCFNSQFVADITIPDGTVLKPYEKFHKVWRIQNTGTCAWDEGFGLILWAGPDLGGYPQYFSKGDQPVGAGGVVDLGVEMRAPPEPGDYVAHWVMVNDVGKTFGGDLTVFIKVVK